MTAKTIHRGTALLDRVYPRWEEEIDLGRLKLMLADDCVLGQLYDGYLNGVNELWPDDRDRYEHAMAAGFNASSVAGFRRLDEAWRRAIKRRLAKRAAS